MFGDIPLLTASSFFFFLPPRQPLPPLDLKTRIEVPERHLTSPLGLQTLRAHPGMEQGEDHPSGTPRPGCLGQFTAPTGADCIAAILEGGDKVTDIV